MIACEGDDVVCSLVQDEQCELMHNVLFFFSAAGFLLMIKKKKKQFVACNITFCIRAMPLL